MHLFCTLTVPKHLGVLLHHSYKRCYYWKKPEKECMRPILFLTTVCESTIISKEKLKLFLCTTNTKPQTTTSTVQHQSFPLLSPLYNWTHQTLEPQLPQLVRAVLQPRSGSRKMSKGERKESQLFHLPHPSRLLTLNLTHNQPDIHCLLMVQETSSLETLKSINIKSLRVLLQPRKWALES